MTGPYSNRDEISSWVVWANEHPSRSVTTEWFKLEGLDTIKVIASEDGRVIQTFILAEDQDHLLPYEGAY